MNQGSIAVKTLLSQREYEGYKQHRSSALRQLLETTMQGAIPTGYGITSSGSQKLSNAVLRLHPTKAAAGMLDVHIFYGCCYRYVPESTKFEITRESVLISLGRMGPSAWTRADEYLQEGRMEIQVPVGAPLEAYAGQLLAVLASTPTFAVVIGSKVSLCHFEIGLSKGAVFSGEAPLDIKTRRLSVPQDVEDRITREWNTPVTGAFVVLDGRKKLLVPLQDGWFAGEDIGPFGQQEQEIVDARRGHDAVNGSYASEVHA